jgi:hypothetical protein
MPRGAAYYNGYYPGLIRVVPNAAFWVVLDDGEVMLNVVRHVRPVVATDFSNTFRRRAEGGRVFLDHPIRDVPEDSVAANFRLHSGETDWAIYTKEHDYLFYRRHPFTEITVGVEVEDVERLPAGLGGFFDPAIRRLVELYRAATRDVVIRVDSRVQVVREQVVRYREPARETAFERLVDHVPRRYDRPMVLAVQETVHDTPVVTRTPEEIAQVLGHHLASNTQVSDAQRALIDAFERLVVAQDPRFSLVEVLSVVEVVAMDFVNAVRRGHADVDERLRRAEEQRGRVALREVVNGYLPALLAPVEGATAVIRGLNIALDGRDATLHRREPVSQVQAQEALEAAQQLVFAIESFWRELGA